MRALIIGGGIGGHAAALALRQRALPVALYTSGPGPTANDAGNAGLWLPPNAMRIFEKLELDAAVREAGALLERVVVERPDGPPLHAVDLSASAQGAPSVAVSRGTLRGLLAGRLPPAVRHGGMTCTGISGSRGGITARFEDGTEVSGEVLVGADGADSGVRRRLFPDATLQEAGQVRYAGMASSPPEALPGGGRVAREVWGDGLRFGYLPLGDGVYWFATQRAADVPASARAPRAMKATLGRRYAGFPVPAASLVAATPAKHIVRAELRDLAPLERWHRGRVALLGDAAHAATPSLGQGAAQAIEDAYVLALALDEHGVPGAAFSEYEALRLKRARRVVKRSRRTGRVAQAQGLWARLRDGALRLAPGTLSARPLRQLFAPRV